MSDLLWRLGVAHQHGWRCYLRDNPPRILAVTSLPRVILQALYFILLARVVGGPAGEEYAVVGVAAVTMTLFTSASMGEVAAVEAQWGTFYRHRNAKIGPFAVFLSRSVPHLVAGLASTVVILAVVVPVTGHPGLALRLAGLLPVYALMALTSGLAGLALGILSSPSHNEVLASNILIYATLVGTGSVVPVGRLGALGQLGQILPMRHGLAAVRALLAGGPYLGQLLAEVAVGAGWLAVGWGIVRLRLYLATVRGIEDSA